MVRAETASASLRCLGLALLIAVLPGSSARAAEDPILSRLAGEWTGHGTYKQSADAAEERMFCKVTNTLVQNGTALEQRGRCSVASGSGPIDGTITAAGGGRYSGTLMSLASEGPASFSGNGGGGRLTLSMTFVDAHTHQAAKGVTTMTLSGNGYHLLSTRNEGGKSWTPTDITFAK